MIDLASNIFSLSESEELKNLLNNPKDDFQKVISLMEKKVVENTERVIESEKKYRSLITVLTNIGFGIDIVSKDHKIFFQNDVLKENFGDCLGEVCYEKYRGLDHQCDFCQMEETLKFNEIKRNELMGVDDRAYEIISAPYPNPDGTYDKVLEVIIDITERKIVEQKLRESEEKYRILTEQSLMGIFIFQEGKFKYINQAVSDINGYTVEEMLNWNSLEIAKTIYSEDLEKIITNLKRSEQGDIDDQSSSIFRLINKTGKIKWVEEFNKKIEFQGNPASMVTLIDITSRVKSEEELKKTEERFRSLIENTTDSVFYYEFTSPIPIDLPVHEQVKRMYDCILVDCNLACAKSYGVEKVEDVIGRNFTELFGTTPKSLDTLFRDLIMGGYRIIEGVGIEKIPEADDRYFLTNGYGVIENGKLLRMWGTFRDITDQKVAEQKMIESQEKFRTIAEQSFMGIFILQEVKFKYANQTLSNIIGYPLEKILKWTQNNVFRNIHPEDFANIAETYRKNLQGEPVEMRASQFRFKHKNGSFIWLETFSKRIEYQNKPATLTSIVDITEKKTSERKLKESEEKYRGLINNITDIIFELKSNGKCTYVSNQLFEISGFNPEEMIEQNVFQYLHPEDFLNVTEKVKDAFQKGIRISTDFRLQHKDGFYVPISANFNVIRINGEQKFIGVLRDNTEKKQAEQKLTESEEKYRTLAEKSVLGIAILQDDIVQYVNKQLANLFGYTVEEIMEWGKGAFLNVIYPEDRKLVAEQARKKQQGETDFLPQYQFRGIKKNGDLIWLELFSIPINYQGKVADFVTIHNITERLKAQQELLKLNQLKSELLRRTSHELKTPLVSIKGFTELLLKVHRDKLDALVISTLNEIEQGCLRLENLIGDILKTAELESGAIQPNKSEEDLSFLVRICVNEIKGFSKLRNHTINLAQQENLITYFEKEQIHQVISNILNNAVKYTPPNGIIDIKSYIRDEFIILSIQDTGMGFTEEEKSIIFKQFGKIERYGQGLDIITEGSGLGLFISKKIIELHDGQIWVESEGRNKGSTFYISLPLIQN